MKENFVFLEENQITMTYEVEWTPSETRWASRYVVYNNKTKIQDKNICNLC